MRPEAAQLALPVHLRDDATLDNFLFGARLAPLKALIEQQLSSEGELSIFLHGPAGSGRSHLLQAACHLLPAGSSLYLPLDQLAERSAAEVLAGIEELPLVCMDNIDAIAGNADWETGMFHLVNRAREAGCRLLFSANAAPRRLNLRLADLQSRLGWGVVYQLPEPDDADKLAILQFRAARRGLALEDEAASYILTRAPRAMGALLEILERLDRESMAAQRQLTIPFIKSRLGW